MEQAKKFLRNGFWLALFMVVLRRFWAAGWVGKVVAMTAVIAWIVMQWSKAGWGKRKLTTILTGYPLVAALCIFWSQFPTFTSIMAAVAFAFCAFMCWREKRGVSP